MRAPTMDEYGELILLDHKASLSEREATAARADHDAAMLSLAIACDIRESVGGVGIVGGAPVWVDRQGKPIVTTGGGS